MNENFETSIDEYSRYRPGITVFEDSPVSIRHDNMLYLVAYDVRAPKRLAKVAKTCNDYGIRVEYSVFECDLTEDQFALMWRDLLAIIEIDEDVILAYRLCGSCVKQIESAGVVRRPGKVLLYYV